MVNTEEISIGDEQTRPWAEFPGLMEPHDYAMARLFTEHVRVAAIPLSAFHEHANLHMSKPWLRFCFCKRAETVAEAAHRLSCAFPPCSANQ
jgi:aspartate/methionine/tyrosine aminotransferase